jgi:pyrroline-5-carboxylate reductase
MGTAILAGLLTKMRSPGAEARITRFIACVNSEGSVERLKTRFRESLDRVTVLRQDNIKGMEEADIVLLACKPYMIDSVLSAEKVSAALTGKLMISVVVGTPTRRIHAAIQGIDLGPPKCFVVRTMPNLAAEFGESMTVIETTNIPDKYLEITNWIFLQLGKTVSVTPDVYDVGGVLAGAAGVYLSVAFDGVLDGAVSQGIKRPEARKMMTQALRSLARLLENGDTPDALREKFSSPRGTTIEGLMSLEEDRVRYAYTKAIVKATKRSQSM